MLERAEALVIGAGPGGLAAAALLGEHGVDTLVVDEQPAPGGQIHRQPPAGFDAPRSPAGTAMIERATSRPSVRWLHATTALGAFSVATDPDAYGGDLDAPDEGPVVALATGDELRRVAAGTVLLATGAYDLPVAFPGWTLPGVMAAGGVQAFLKSQQVLPGRRLVLAGGHPLLLVIADQLRAAGADIAEVAFVQPRPPARDALSALPALAGGARQLAAAAGPAARLRRSRVPVRWSTLVVGAKGTEALEAVALAPVDAAWRPIPGTEREVECDTLALGYGFVASTELARQAGCRVAWAPDAGGWVVAHDRWMRSSVERIHVAGEVTGVAGAAQAEVEGELAALGMVRAMGRVGEEEATRLARPLRARLARLRRFGALVRRRFAVDHRALAALADDSTVVCRCEEVTAGQLARALEEHPHLGDTDAVKQLTRVGMGPCQGRMCQLHVAQSLAAARRTSVEAVGPYTARPPVKPIPLSVLVAAAQKSGRPAATQA